MRELMNIHEFPKISIIIPAYNSERTLFKCLTSIFEANYPPDKREVILVDNNSTDETLLVAERFTEVKVVKEPKQGRSIARNTGAKQASGDYFFFLDSDVFVEKDYFVELITVLSRKGVGGVQGKIIPSDIDGQESINRYRYRTIEAATNETFCLLNLMVRESPMINSAACAYRKEAFWLVKGFDSELERHEDIDLARRVCYSGYYLAAAEKGVAHVIYHGEGWSSYFWRSFQDGYTKIDYNRKWSLPQKWLGTEEDEAFYERAAKERECSSVHREEVSERIKDLFPKKPRKEKGHFNPLFYVWWSLRDLGSAVWNYLKTLDTHFLFLFINHVCKLTGRVLGPLRAKKHFAPLEIPMASPEIRLQEIRVKSGKPYFLKPTLRFVLLTSKIYIVDLEGHRLLGESPDYPHLFSYLNFQQLGLFKEFDGNSEEDMVYEILKFMKLLKQ